MSSTLPPSEPPAQPPHGAGQPEILDASGGTALADPTGSGRGSKRGLVIGGGVIGLAIVGGGAWAAMSFFGAGAQPAEALPAGTLGYASIDLDPSGGQKIEALRTINKFPAFKDVAGLDAGDDLRKSIFDAIQGEAGCEGLDFEDDIDPWLGDRAAVAAVKGSDGSIDPVVVVQVKDEAAFTTGIKTLVGCGGASDQTTGYVVEGDWATIAETQDIADDVAAATAKASLADDETFTKWVGEAGDPGIATLYAAPSAGTEILSALGEDLNMFPDEVKSQMADFQGVAATIRFADGTLELEAATQTPKGAEDVLGTSAVADQVGSLPDDTAAVLGASFGKGWFGKALDGAVAGLGSSSSEDLTAEIEQATGLTLPDDIDTLTQDGVVVAVGPGLDPDAIVNSTDLSDVPVAIKLHGDADEIEAVVAKLQQAVPDGTSVLGTSTDGDTVVVGPSSAYRDELAAGGSLGDSEAFQKVIPDADSPSILYLDVDAFQKTIDSFGDTELSDNIEPLAGIGISQTSAGGVSHVVVRIGTD